MERLIALSRWLQAILSVPLFSLGDARFTLGSLLYLLLLLILLFYGSGRVRAWIAERLLARRGIDIGVRQAVGTITRYLILLVGLLIIFESLGIDFTALTILAGALGVGIGFGLQNIASNFVSGLIILFERPVKVGDRIEVGGVVGDVAAISARATTVITNDNIAVIVPNAEFISSTVVNWSHTGRQVRFGIPVGVSYSADLSLVRGLLLEVAAGHSGVLRDPPPDVLLREMGASSLNFELRVWTRDYTTRPGVLRSELSQAIIEAFRKHGVEIPFPQRDLRLRSVPEGFPAAARS